MEVTDAIASYQYAERVKSELIIASNLISGMSRLSPSEVVGGAKVLLMYLESVLAEVRIVYNATRSPSILEADRKIAEAIAGIRFSDQQRANKSIAKAITAVTTLGNVALQTLKDNNLLK